MAQWSPMSRDDSAGLLLGSSGYRGGGTPRKSPSRSPGSRGTPLVLRVLLQVPALHAAGLACLLLLVLGFLSWPSSSCRGGQPVWAPTAGGGSGNSGGSGDGTCNGTALTEAVAANDTLWAQGCVRLERACVDQGSILLYMEHYNSTWLPQPFTIEAGEGRKWDMGNYPPPIQVRSAAWQSGGSMKIVGQEGAAYLNHPRFSECTVPVVFHPMRPHNFAHFFRDNAAKLWGILQDTPWAPHIKLVLATGHGAFAAHAMNYEVMQPMSRLRMETWADFTARLPSVQDRRKFLPASWAHEVSSAPYTDAPPSWEGGQQRCFRQMLVCPRGLNITRWPVHGLGQHLVKHYGQTGNPPVSILKDGTPYVPPPAADVAPAVEASAASAVDGAPAGAGGSIGEIPVWRWPGEAAGEQTGVQPSEPQQQVEQPQPVQEAQPQPEQPQGKLQEERELRILFHQRSGEDRQIINAAEVLAACNSWRHTAADGRRFRGVCSETEPNSLFAGMAAAQQADVFVAMHGANQANGWLLRPGSSMIELQACGFDAGRAHLQYPLYNMKDRDTGVQWWMLSQCDPDACTPSSKELQGVVGDADFWPKNRNMRIQWSAIATALAAAVEVRGDMKEYRRRWNAGEWWWFMGPEGAMRHAGPGNAKEIRCPPEWSGVWPEPAAPAPAVGEAQLSDFAPELLAGGAVAGAEAPQESEVGGQQLGAATELLQTADEQPATAKQPAAVGKVGPAAAQQRVAAQMRLAVAARAAANRRAAAARAAASKARGGSPQKTAYDADVEESASRPYDEGDDEGEDD